MDCSGSDYRQIRSKTEKCLSVETTGKQKLLKSDPELVHGHLGGERFQELQTEVKQTIRLHIVLS